MKKIFFVSLLFVFLLFFLSFSVIAGDKIPNRPLKNGIHIPITAFAFVYAGSKPGTNDGGTIFYRNDPCFPRQDGILHIVAIDRNHTLAKIYYPDGTKVGGATCPNKAYIWVPSRHLKSFDRLYERMLLRKDKLIKNKDFYRDFEKKHKIKF